MLIINALATTRDFLDIRGSERLVGTVLASRSPAGSHSSPMTSCADGSATPSQAPAHSASAASRPRANSADRNSSSSEAKPWPGRKENREVENQLPSIKTLNPLDFKNKLLSLFQQDYGRGIGLFLTTRALSPVRERCSFYVKKRRCTGSQ